MDHYIIFTMFLPFISDSALYYYYCVSATTALPVSH
jgi:hypothetical protein